MLWLALDIQSKYVILLLCGLVMCCWCVCVYLGIHLALAVNSCGVCLLHWFQLASQHTQILPATTCIQDLRRYLTSQISFLTCPLSGVLSQVYTCCGNIAGARFASRMPLETVKYRCQCGKTSCSQCFIIIL